MTSNPRKTCTLMAAQVRCRGPTRLSTCREEADKKRSERQGGSEREHEGRERYTSVYQLKL